MNPRYLDQTSYLNRYLVLCTWYDIVGPNPGNISVQTKISLQRWVLRFKSARDKSGRDFINPFTTGNPFLGAKLLGFSIGRGSGALKGLRAVTSACPACTKRYILPATDIIVELITGLSGYPMLYPLPPRTKNNNHFITSYQVPGIINTCTKLQLLRGEGSPASLRRIF